MNYAEQVKQQTLSAIQTAMFIAYGPIQFAYTVNDTEQCLYLLDETAEEPTATHRCLRDTPLSMNLPMDCVNIVSFFEAELAKEDGID